MSVFFITGASRGIGAYTSRFFAAQGHTVYAGVRKPDADHELDAAEGDIRIVALDVTAQESVNAAVNLISAEAGGVDVLVNNAGVAWFAAAEDMSEWVLRQTMETNFFGAIRCAQSVLPMMRKRGQGHIITISSIAAVSGLPLESAYCASKRAIESYSESLRHEVARFGVNVAVIQPGITAGGLSNSVPDPKAPTKSAYTDLLEHTFDFYAAAQHELESPALICAAIQTTLANSQPEFRLRLGRFGELVNAMEKMPPREADKLLAQSLGIEWWHQGSARPVAQLAD